MLIVGQTIGPYFYPEWYDIYDLNLWFWVDVEVIAMKKYSTLSRTGASPSDAVSCDTWGPFFSGRGFYLPAGDTVSVF